MPGAQPTVTVHWPKITEVTPAKFGLVLANTTRLLSTASLELARLHIIQEQP